MAQNASYSQEPSLWDCPGLRGGGAGLESASPKPVSLSLFVSVFRCGHGQRVVWRNGARPVCGVSLHFDGGLLFRPSVSFLRRQRHGHRIFRGVCSLRPGCELGEFHEKEK
jgi:hypothetical protein